MTQFLFFLAAIGAISAAIGVVLLRNPFYAVLSLAAHLVSLALLFLLLHAEFVAFGQVVIYAGAVMVLYVFVVSYVGGGAQLPSGPALRILGPLFALALVIELFLATLGSALKGVKGKGAPFVPGFGTPRHIGTLFLTKYLFPFEAASILLLVAAVGAVVLARRRRGLEGEAEAEIVARTAIRPAYTGTLAEGAGMRVPGTGEPPEAETVVTGTDEGGW